MPDTPLRFLARRVILVFWPFSFDTGELTGHHTACIVLTINYGEVDALDIALQIPIFKDGAGLLSLLCAVLLVVTSLAHSILGERRLISPLLRQRGGVLDSDMARFLLRAAWHFMTVLFWVLAASIVAGGDRTGTTETVLLVATAIGVGGAGIYDLVKSRGRHIGWPLLVATGLAAALSAAARLG